MKGNKKMLVVGFGKSGKAAARFGLQQGMQVTVTDLRKAEELHAEQFPFARERVEWVLGSHPVELFTKTDLVVTSPGVPPSTEGLKTAKQRGIPVVGDLELALPLVHCPILAVTGTNGKTTTVCLIEHLLKTAGKKVVLAGNVGTPLLDCLDLLQGAQALVLEVSSFQLETTPSLKPTVAVWLNVTSDHVDWHESFEAYVEAKTKLVRGVGTKGCVVFNADDTVVAQVVSQFPVRRFGFSVRKKQLLGAWVEGENLWFKMSPHQPPFSLSIRGVPLKGIQNWENMMAAVLTVHLFGITPEILQPGLKSFRGLPHRMEWVDEWKGIRFVNDSKATNVGAVVRALESLEGSVIWLAGGRSKQAPDKASEHLALPVRARGVRGEGAQRVVPPGYYDPLVSLVRQKVTQAFFFGEAALELQQAFQGTTKTVVVKNLEEAVNRTAVIAKSGDIVLLSPACSSFDQFKDYAERGEVFRKCVRLLRE